MQDRIEELRARRSAALEMGGPEGLRLVTESGRLPVRDRIEQLLDPESWFELGALGLPERRTAKHVPGDAVLTGFGRLSGRPVAVIALDASVLAGSTAPTSMRKQGRLIEHAQRSGIPLVFLCDADGGRIPDVMGWRFSGLPLDFQTFLDTPVALPEVPRAAAVLAPSYGDSALHASTAHFVVMVQSGSVALSGPSVIESAIGEQVTDEGLGGPIGAQEAGNVHLVVESEEDAFRAVEAFLSYLPANASLAAPVTPPRSPSRAVSELEHLVPVGGRSGYDMRHVLEAVADSSTILSWGSGWGQSLITAFARIEGSPVGLVANQPLVRAGALDPPALAKELAFIGICDTFNLPLVFLQDVPGLMIGTQAERAGILRAYERVVLAISHARVPKVAIVLRKAYGGGHFAMAGRPTHPDFLFAWPTAEMGFMAPETGVRTVYRRRLRQVLDEQGSEAHEALVEELTEDWLAEGEPWEAAAHLYLDDVIEPAATRSTIARCIEIAWGARTERVARQW